MRLYRSTISLLCERSCTAVQPLQCECPPLGMASLVNNVCELWWMGLLLGSIEVLSEICRRLQAFGR